MREVLFDADEMFPVADAIGCFSVTIPIIDDNINEADQVFIIHLNLAQENLGAITLSRNKSLIWINDDDCKLCTATVTVQISIGNYMYYYDDI